VRTVEGLAPAEGPLHPVQQAFHENHALQCGFCTPGFVMLLAGALEQEPEIAEDEEALTALLSSNLCRCTGYVGIRAAAHAAARVLREERDPTTGPLSGDV
jgi:carbon-monoxide dehydrogenase small subunit